MTNSQLDPDAQRLIDAGSAAGLPPVYTLPIDDARDRMRSAFISNQPTTDILEVRNIVIPGPLGGIPARIYRPSLAVLPCIMFFHGGGWTLNDLDTHDHLCRLIANDVECVVISVDYRRSPEAKYPAPLDDCFLATAWASANHVELNIDLKRIAVMGDSSGGTCALSVALLARDRSFPRLRQVVAVYPVTDSPDLSRGSYVERGSGYSLDSSLMEWFWDSYTDETSDLSDPYLCPVRLVDASDLPRMVVVVAEFDPLRDEGLEFAVKVRSGGGEVISWTADDQMHGFLLQTSAISNAKLQLSRICQQLRLGFSE